MHGQPDSGIAGTGKDGGGKADLARRVTVDHKGRDGECHDSTANQDFNQDIGAFDRNVQEACKLTLGDGNGHGCDRSHSVAQKNEQGKKPCFDQDQLFEWCIHLVNASAI